MNKRHLTKNVNKRMLELTLALKFKKKLKRKCQARVYTLFVVVQTDGQTLVRSVTLLIIAREGGDI